MDAVNELATALARAQGEMQNPGFDSVNPHFKNKFASLASVRNAVVPILSKHGIFISQNLTTSEGTVSCTTILIHSSGQQLSFGPLTLPVSKNDAQGFGSAATYCRRYALMAVACVVGDVDDDGNAASGKVTYGSNPAYDAPHAPQGEAVKSADPDLAKAAAKRMDEILSRDVDEHMKAALVLDEHDVLNKAQDVYMAASVLLPASRRNAWKSYVGMAKKLEAAEPKARM